MATLFVMQGRDKGKRYDLRGAELTLGRDGTNRIQVNDSEVSRRHAQISHDESGYLLVDLGSSNGSFVNGERLTEHRLKNGDRVLLGRTLLLFTEAGDQSSGLHQDVEIIGQNEVEGSR